MWTHKLRSWKSVLVHFIVSLISLVVWISPTNGTITVISLRSNESVAVIQDVPASFLPEQVLAYGVQGLLVYSNPPNACEPVMPPPRGYYPPSINFILLAQRYDCNFQDKIENAHTAGYDGIIVHNVNSETTEAMGVDTPNDLVTYACFVGETDGHRLINYSLPLHKGYFIRIQDDNFSPSGYLLPFAILVAVCFVVMLICMCRLLWQQIVRWIQERNRVRRRILSTSALKKLPITKWTKGDPYETCAVCLEDFVEHDKIRVLPCSHGFHGVCIDPWLTKGRRVCPICKRKVVLTDERLPPSSDTDTDDEGAPLLGTPSTSNPPPNPASSTSTFVQRNPFRRSRNVRPVHATTSSDSSDTASTSSGGSDCSGSIVSMSEAEIVTSHQNQSQSSVLAEVQVHSQSLPSTSGGHLRKHHSHGHASHLSHSTTAILDPNNHSINRHDTDTPNSHFYISCQEEPEDDDEEMLDCSVEVTPTTNDRDRHCVVVVDNSSVPSASPTHGSRSGSLSSGHNTIV